MNNLFKLPAKKIKSKYSFVNDAPIGNGSAPNDTQDPTTISPITSTHIFLQMR